MARNFNPAKESNKVAICAAASAVAFSVGSFLVEFLPHTFFIERYKKVFQMYRLGEGVPLDENIKTLFDQVMVDLKITEKDKSRYEPFTVTGFDLHQAGIVNPRSKSIIGIPINYTYKDKFSVETSDIRVGLDREPLNIYHPAADDLIDALVLSDKAKKYGIAREILMIQKDLPLYRSIETPTVFTASLLATEIARQKLKLFNKGMTILLYVGSGLFSFSLWFQIRDSLNTYFEQSVDQELAELGPEYVEGGREFYEKIQKRNIALRTLLGKYGAKQYNRDGDEIFFVRHKRTPVTYRKKFFENITIQSNAQQAAS